MSFGRPSKAALEQRKRSLVRVLALQALKSREAVKAVSEELGVGPRAVKKDLQALGREQAADVPRASAEIVARLGAARTFEALLIVEARLVSDYALKRITRDDYQQLLAGCRELRQTIKDSEERTPDREGALVVEGLKRLDVGAPDGATIGEEGEDQKADDGKGGEA